MQEKTKRTSPMIKWSDAWEFNNNTRKWEQNKKKDK